MRKLYNTTQDKFIVYNNHQIVNRNIPSVIFLHGLMSDMNSAKSLYLIDYCKKNNYNFITFDNFGHGSASGKFQNQTISAWLSGVELILNKLVNDQVILIGSSMGGWLALLSALKFKNRIKALICLAAAPDFTVNIWQSLSLQEQQEMKHNGVFEVKGKNRNCHHYPISYKLIEEAKDHLLLTQDIIDINIPVHLIHGMLDEDVPHDVSIKLLEKLTSKQIVLKLIKDGNHSLSREEDLKIMTNSLEEIITTK